MYITKTDYLEYTFCRKNLWLKKHKPSLFEGLELSDFEKKIIEEGNLADAEARNLFPGGVLVEGEGPEVVKETDRLLQKKEAVIFQAAFSVEGFFIRADILVYDKSKDAYNLFEVKASNEIKRKEPHHYINDLAFQKNVIEKTGLNIYKSGVIYLNREYKRVGAVDYKELFIQEDLTEEVNEASGLVEGQMIEMRQYLAAEEEAGCECVYRGRSNQCSTFSYSNPQVPEYSVHDINRIGNSKKILYDWVDRGVYCLDDIDNPDVLTGLKKAQYDVYMSGRPAVDLPAIKEELDSLNFPLNFFDYEGFSSAIPMFAGFGAFEQVPFQYSLHIMQADGSIEHKEYLIEDIEGNITEGLVRQMKKDIDPRGTMIVWYKNYEKQRNEKLAELHPEYAGFINQINEGIFDLMEIFSKGYYIDPAFRGSASIKNVLPVIVPELTYKNLNISKGDQASERWQRMISPETPEEEKEQIKRDLLTYCQLDTWAMVKIYQFLKKL